MLHCSELETTRMSSSSSTSAPEKKVTSFTMICAVINDELGEWKQHLKWQNAQKCPKPWISPPPFFCWDIFRAGNTFFGCVVKEISVFLCRPHPLWQFDNLKGRPDGCRCRQSFFRRLCIIFFECPTTTTTTTTTTTPLFVYLSNYFETIFGYATTF